MVRGSRNLVMVKKVEICKTTLFSVPPGSATIQTDKAHIYVRLYWLITACQRSCGKVMFSQVFTGDGWVSLVPCPFWGGWVSLVPWPFFVRWYLWYQDQYGGLCMSGGWVCLLVGMSRTWILTPGVGYVQVGMWLLTPLHTWDLGYYRIQSTSGWYASYWNAFLFYLMFFAHCTYCWNPIVFD